MSEVYKSLSDPTRRHILEMLREREMSAGEIADRVHVSKPTLSGHLAKLKAAGLIDMTRQGTTLIYRLNLSVLEEAMMSLMSAFRIGQDATAPLPRTMEDKA
ncbi:autorepressor SdpR family transcription factor [Asticcacaulis sp. DW145]|uniref:Autorepressor SdpR family transcription factor n=1 Tax=Asticcacaulis currens TaxID=2984210 RepID=A0ABT5IAF7_9CAUL|nr:autorepressor SdpR family transcription factor [Asticcacaulis currens]MDC7693113.1 autorepressor SdpR family transcription factor [Asticcacaulis currens]BEV09705.1 autorepressor SdpR family transcription factor [Asticcacaulis sp. DW145]